MTAQHQRTQHFLTDSPWSDHEVRLEAARYGISALTERESFWLLMEWEDGEKALKKFHLVTASSDVTKKWLIRQVKQRWRTERASRDMNAYQDMKGQLGLDHFEGRRYSGSRGAVRTAGGNAELSRQR